MGPRLQSPLSLLMSQLSVSDFDPIMKNTKVIHDRPEKATYLLRKWKGGIDYKSTLKEKWLTFSRPLTHI